MADVPKTRIDLSALGEIDMSVQGDLAATGGDTWVYPNDENTEFWAMMNVDVGDIVLTIEALANNDHGVKHDLILTLADVAVFDGQFFLRVKDLPVKRFGTTLRVALTTIPAGSVVTMKAVRIPTIKGVGDNTGNVAPAPGASPGTVPIEDEITGDPWGNLRAAVADGDVMANDEHTVLWINNGGASPMDVWAHAAFVDEDGFFIDQKVTVPAGNLVTFPELPVARFGRNVTFTYTVVTSVTVVGLKRRGYPPRISR